MSSVGLPAGWLEYKAPDGKPYYYNTLSKGTTYTKPTTPATAIIPGAPVLPTQPVAAAPVPVVAAVPKPLLATSTAPVLAPMPTSMPALAPLPQFTPMAVPAVAKVPVAAPAGMPVLAPLPTTSAVAPLPVLAAAHDFKTAVPLQPILLPTAPAGTPPLATPPTTTAGAPPFGRPASFTQFQPPTTAAPPITIATGGAHFQPRPSQSMLDVKGLASPVHATTTAHHYPPPPSGHPPTRPASSSFAYDQKDVKTTATTATAHVSTSHIAVTTGTAAGSGNVMQQAFLKQVDGIKSALATGADVKAAVVPASKATNTGNLGVDLKNALRGLKSANSSAGDMTANFERLDRLTKNARAAGRLSRNKETIHTLLDGIKQRPKFGKMVEYGIECLKNLAVDEVSVEELLDEGVIEMFVNVRKLNPYNEKIATLIDQALQAFCLNDRLAKMIMDRLGTDGHLFTLKKHVEPQTLVACGTAMYHLTRWKPNAEAYVKAGAVSAIAGVIQSNPHRVDVITAMTMALVRLAPVNVESAVEIVKNGSLANIMKCVSKFPENSTLVEHCVNLVYLLAKAGNGNVEAIKAMGAADILFGVVEMHPDNEMIKALAGSMFRLITGQDAITDALAGVTKNENIAQNVAKVSSLLLVDENIDILVRNGGIAALLAMIAATAALDRSDTNAKILESGCRALMRCCVTAESIHQVLSAGGVALLMSLIEKYSTDEKLMAAVIQALSKLVTRAENAEYLSKFGCIEAVIKLIHQYPNSHIIAKAGLEFMNAMSNYPTVISQMVAAGAIQALLLILKNHGKDTEIAKNVIACLTKICGASRENMAALANAGGLEILIATLNQHQSNPDVVKACFLLIEAAAYVPEYLDPLRKLGAVGAILAAMEKNKKDQMLVALGHRVLSVLAGKADTAKAAVDLVVKYTAEIVAVQFAGATISGLSSSLLDSVKEVYNLACINTNWAALNQAGAINSVLGAMIAATKLQNSELRSQLLLHCAKTLQELCKDAANFATFNQVSGLKAMLRAALADMENEDLAERAFEMAVLVTRDPAQIGKLVSEGCIEDLIALMKAFPFNTKIQSDGLKSLTSLCAQAEGLTRLFACGGADVLSEAIKNNLDDSVMVTDALMLLGALCTIDDATAMKIYQQINPLDVLMMLMKKYPNNAPILLACSKILCALILNEQMAGDIGDKGFINELVAAIRTHYGSEQLIQWALIALDSLSSLERNLPKFTAKDLAVIDLAKWCQKSYAKNVQIVESAEHLIQTLLALIAKKEAEDKRQAELDMLQNFNDDACDLLLRQLEVENDPNKLWNMCQQINKLAERPVHNKRLFDRGGLQALARVIKRCNKQENPFYSAGNGFLQITDHAGDNCLPLLEEQVCFEALLELASPHPHFSKELDPAQLTKVLTLLAKLKLKKIENIDALLKSGLLEALLKIIYHGESEAQTVPAAKMVAKLSANDKVFPVLSGLIDIRALIAAMRRNFKVTDFLRYGCYLLGTFARRSDALKLRIGAETGVGLLVQIIAEYSGKVEPLIENACMATSHNTLNCEPNIAYATASNGIVVVIQAMRDHPNNADLLEPAINILCNLCYKNDANKTAICAAGGAQTIVETVLSHFASVDIMLAALKTLGNLAFNAVNIAIIIKAGGISAIVAGMAQHQSELDIISDALKVLTNLASTIDEDNFKIMNAEGAVQAVLECASKHTSQLDVELAALGCLCNMGRHTGTAFSMVKYGAVDVVSGAMSSASDHVDMNEKALRLLALLSSIKEPDGKDKMIHAKATTCAMTGIRLHSKQKLIVSLALKSLAQLAHSEESARKMALEGPIPLLLVLINTMIKDPVVISEVFQPLSSLCRSPDNAAAMAENCMKLIVVALALHASNLNFNGVTMTFLTNLCVHPKAADFSVATKLNEAILGVYTVFKAEPAILIRALRAMENIAYSSQATRDHMKAVKCVEGCTEIKTASAKTRPDVERQAQLTIDAINKRPAVMVPAPRKTAKNMFNEVEKDGFDKEFRNFLWSGQIVRIHTANGSDPMHMFFDKEFRYMILKPPNDKTVVDENKTPTYKLTGVDRGRKSKNLQKTKLLSSEFSLREDLVFVLHRGKTSFDVEVEEPQFRERWVMALTLMLDHLAKKKIEDSKFTSR